MVSQMQMFDIQNASAYDALLSQKIASVVCFGNPSHQFMLSQKIASVVRFGNPSHQFTKIRDTPDETYGL